MRGCSLIAWVGCASILAAYDGFSEVTSSFPALDAERAAHTNWVENTVTNLIEMRVSRNRFVTEYRTNWIDRVSTNNFAIYKTNQLTRNVTNRFIVDAWRTNVVDAYRTNWHRLHLTNDIAVTAMLTNVIDTYHTNWISRNVTNAIVLTRFQTNVVDSYHTNWEKLVLTNEMAVNLVRTNFVEAFNTNWQTLSFTNWQTVVLMKTNWVTQFVTNVAQIDLPKTVTVTQTAPAKPAAPAVARSTGGDNSTSDDPVIEVVRTSKPAANGLVEVELKIRWPADTADAPPVQQWRIEREEGAFLSFGQEQECRKELPVGNYTVQARLQRDADSPSFVLKGTLTVTIREAVVQQRTDRSKLAAVTGR